MTLRQGLTLIALMGLVGGMKAAQQTAIWHSAYRLGQRADALHELENHTQWLSRDVIALASPTQLAQAREAHHLTLVAWSSVSVTPPTPQPRLRQAKSPERLALSQLAQGESGVDR